MSMRRATSDTGLVEEAGVVVGIGLGYDFTTEHECGIRQLLHAFKVDTDQLGYASRRNTIVPAGLAFFDLGLSEQGGGAVLGYMPDRDEHEAGKALERHARDGNLRFYGDDEQIVGAWDDSSFGIHVRPEHSKLLHSLSEAFRTKNGVIVASSPKAFGNPGLNILDYRLIPEEIRTAAIEQDKAQRVKRATMERLQEESGVFPALEAAGIEEGRDYVFLGVRDLDKGGNANWWLNGFGSVCGWFPTEDLLAWARGEGPLAGVGRGSR